MWDSEGKDVDLHVVRKLLSSYPDFFREHILGKDLFLTYRIPNPKIEGAERKVFAETLENIPIAFDVAERFYGRPVPAVFEVILPFTTSSSELVAVAKYYEKIVVGKESIDLHGELSVKDLVGEVSPKRIEVIPLVEDMQSILNVRQIVGEYVKAVRPNYIRVFIARSDPAMNYGLVPATILAKWALRKLKELEVPVFPVIGVGSAPFRGNLRPSNVERVSEEYRGVYTFTVQSSFKYDNPEDEVRKSVSYLNGLPGDGHNWEEALFVLEPYVRRYQREIEGLANVINLVATLVPKRRARKLHVGLFGYSRSSGNVTLPRAITFVASLYSIGIPPEVLGLASLARLSEEQWSKLSSVYLHLRDDLRESLRFADYQALDRLRGGPFNVDDSILRSIREDLSFAEEVLGIRIGGEDYESRTHRLLSELVAIALEARRPEEGRKNVLEMALLRKFLG
ncbi:phosphoenolpyruvate carboxylase [Sulfodiicoccus acidiphilus]|uniref:Phosphoenolpyruvate carboxylase n=2 Tax=Sulfodiicoccus acidiphilus TaxID=1670455 RepID=A0A348B2E9_9CREN|nr:phosphoenolpyruvate carboxylase [Sulfodiicoccus acidiphilus]GGT90095.1 phosphoenolpyruvate carboxylase [Sulfodiicoccus acidiphilus]